MELRHNERTERKNANAIPIRRIDYVPMTASALILSRRTLILSWGADKRKRNDEHIIMYWKLKREHIKMSSGKAESKKVQTGKASLQRELLIDNSETHI